MIAVEYYKDLQRINNVKNPRLLQPGRVIKAPVGWLGNFPGDARAVSVSGQVELIRENTPRPLQEGDTFADGDQLITGEDGAVVIEFSDASIARVYTDTLLVFSSLKQSYDGSVINARLQIESGRANIISNPQKKRGHRLEIESPAAITAVRGTSFRVGVDEETGDTASEVLDGKVAVSGTGQSVSLRQNQGTLTAIDKPPTAPVSLQPGPDIQDPGLIEDPLGEIGWIPSNKASGYHVRASADENFNSVIYDELVSTASTDDIYFPEDGKYYVSVRVSDKNHIEGLDSIVAVVVNARPEPPLIILPQDDAEIFDNNPSFSWTLPVAGVSGMHFQLDNTPVFDSPIIDQTLPVTDHFDLGSELEPGEYYWRIANIDEEGQGPSTNPMSFTILEQPELVPELEKSASGSFVKIKLDRDPSVPRYHVQVARDEGFGKIVFDQWVADDRFSFKSPTAGSYFIRLGIEDRYTNTIIYGDTQKILVPYTSWKETLMLLFGSVGILILL